MSLPSVWNQYVLCSFELKPIKKEFLEDKFKLKVFAFVGCFFCLYLFDLFTRKDTRVDISGLKGDKVNAINFVLMQEVYDLQLHFGIRDNSVLEKVGPFQTSDRILWQKQKSQKGGKGGWNQLLFK